MRLRTILTIVFAGSWAATCPAADADPPDFNRDIRPILAEYCWKCHGFDPTSRQAGLRLDDRTAATRPTDSGARAIVPGQPAESELLVRLTSTDESLRMPPASVGKRPSPAQIERLRRWIESGAPYQKHWSFTPIVRPVVPEVGEPHPIDAFVVAKLRTVGETLSPVADRDVLIRRVYLDLIGLPPTRNEWERARQEPWEQTVDRLLASPHFGERMAVEWLDAARYADTDGYFGDKHRQMWLWRDWVIEACNRNMPFDQFTIEQLAGDLLPEPTVAQRIATGFNRNHMSNDETGLIDEEYRVEYVADRVETTMSTWLGLTVGCAQCHDHKYDPISQRDYYGIFAFFNNVPETGLLSGSDAPPRISVPTPAQTARLNELTAATTRAVAEFEPLRTLAAKQLAEREADLLAGLPNPPPAGLHLPLEGPAETGARALGTPLVATTGIRGQGLRFDGTRHLEIPANEWSLDEPWTGGFWMLSENSLGCPLSKIEPTDNRRGFELLWQKGRLGINLVSRWGQSAIELVSHEKFPANEWRHVVVRYDGSRRAEGVRLFINGRPAVLSVRRDALAGSLQNNEPWRLARRDDGLGFYGSLDEFRWWPRILSDEDISTWYHSERTRGVLERPADKRSAREAEWLLDDFIDRQADDATRLARDKVREARAAEATQRQEIPTALVMEEKTPRRPTHILERGVYNKPGALVEPSVPAALSAWPDQAPLNRLGLARWLMAPDHPLTARVAVNRLWRLCFGDGLVRTANDFGTQGELPTHPELLDYLAAEYRHDWDTKRLLKLLVTSKTWRQRSAWIRRNGEIFDPENRWLARGARYRLPWEMIRDQALASSGLLVPTVGGPSVKPYQPPGLWEEVSYNAEASYEVDVGPGRYRRSLYTYHKRQAPPPALLVFDGPTREKCTLKRARTNTPLQALVLLNDPTCVEAARALAERVRNHSADDRTRIDFAMACVLARSPTESETATFLQFIGESRRRFENDTIAARRLAGSTESVDLPDRATWTLFVHTLFNLDEALTRR
ncbi:MAG: DUF1553 domain-containing protein [Planctomycetes bacterium]|nr:DUF1553 domain-containing protein [Planctomycetota bacterium]